MTTTRAGSAPQRSTTVRASAVETAMMASDSRAMSASPATRAPDSGGSPSDSGEPGWAATEWKLCTCATSHARATGIAATPDIQWCDCTRS